MLTKLEFSNINITEFQWKGDCPTNLSNDYDNKIKSKCGCKENKRE